MHYAVSVKSNEVLANISFNTVFAETAQLFLFLTAWTLWVCFSERKN